MIDKNTELLREAFSWPRALDEAKAIVRSSPLFKKFISGTPLENDIPVWMAEFSSKLWVWKELETAIADSWVMHGKIKRLESDLQAASTRLSEAMGVIEEMANVLEKYRIAKEEKRWGRCAELYADAHLANTQTLTRAEKFMKGEK